MVGLLMTALALVFAIVGVILVFFIVSTAR